MINAVVFDMDGVIFDTEKIYLKCIKKVGENYNIKISDEEISKLRGTNFETGKKIFEKMYPEINFFDFKKQVNNLKNEDIEKNGLP
ncbi:MAG: HAD hydrolase-like protein, partial [Eubacteriales bacterium]|nr:HAD hydrolase-like protein [Eubacteriales bacterium]